MSRAKRPAIFKNRRKAPCPACLDRDALNLMGRPIFVNGARLSAGCETCGGSGRVQLVDVVGAWPAADPWVWVADRKPAVKVAT